MTYFQNPFSKDFHGNWVLSDRQHILDFVCPRNAGRGDNVVVSWANGPFDSTIPDADGNSRDILTIYFSRVPTWDAWTRLQIDITTTAVSTSSIAPFEIVSALNANTLFSAWFTASLNANNGRVEIYSKKPFPEIHFYVANGRAEEFLKFNARAGVAELPTYFDRHKITHLFSSLEEMLRYTERLGTLIPLYPSNAYGPSGGTSAVDNAIVDEAVDYAGKNLGLDSSSVQEDWELLSGRSGLFTFKKQSVDANDRITQIIEYQAGSTIGDLARLTKYTYTGLKKTPDQITEEPYTLVGADLITP